MLDYNSNNCNNWEAQTRCGKKRPCNVCVYVGVGAGLGGWVERAAEAKARCGQASGTGAVESPLPLPPPQRGAGVRGVPRVPIPRRLGRGPSSLLLSAPRPPLTSGLDWRTAGPEKFESRWGGERRRRAVTLNGVGSRTRLGLPAGGPLRARVPHAPAPRSEAPRCRCALGGTAGCPGPSRSQRPARLHRCGRRRSPPTRSARCPGRRSCRC